jgi:hypothetical protein
MQRIGPKAKERIAINIIAFMVEGAPLTRESRSFIYTWVRNPTVTEGQNHSTMCGI